MSPTLCTTDHRNHPILLQSVSSTMSTPNSALQTFLSFTGASQSSAPDSQASGASTTNASSKYTLEPLATQKLPEELASERTKVMALQLAWSRTNAGYEEWFSESKGYVAMVAESRKEGKIQEKTYEALLAEQRVPPILVAYMAGTQPGKDRRLLKGFREGFENDFERFEENTGLKIPDHERIVDACGVARDWEDWYEHMWRLFHDMYQMFPKYQTFPNQA